MSLRSFHGTYVGSVKRKISGRKGGRKKRAKMKKAAGKVAKTAAGAARSSGSLQDLLSSHLQSKRDALVAALDAAQSRAVKSSDLAAIEAFGKKMDRMRKSLAEYSRIISTVSSVDPPHPRRLTLGPDTLESERFRGSGE